MSSFINVRMLVVITQPMYGEHELMLRARQVPINGKEV